MLFFNVMEVVHQLETAFPLDEDDHCSVLLRVNYELDTAYADPNNTNFVNLLCIQVDVKPPEPGISSFKSWNALIDKDAHWNSKDWKIFMVQPIENGYSCLIDLFPK